MTKQELRKALAINHPDRGGDPEVYRKLIEQYDALNRAPFTNAFTKHVAKLRRQEEMKRRRNALFKP